MNCKVCDSTEVVYSGTDAFMLGIPTEKVCYLCANTYASVKEVVDKWVAEYEALKTKGN